jgi:probable rRNA maturation factor
MVLNHQKHVALNLPATRNYVRRLRETLRLGRRDFNVCFVNNREIQRLNTAFRGKPLPTDVLAFSWEAGAESPVRVNRNGEFKHFLGDVVISAETARRNARLEGHSTANEIRWLILHGLLHLLGYDHATDNGEMAALEYSLRQQLETKASSAKRRRIKKGRAAAGVNGWR